MGKFLYGALFVVVLPVLLAAWAAAANDLIRLPVPESKPLGYGIAAAGLALLLMGTRALWVYGRGLPMSPYPPVRLATEGIFAFIPHPIYTGFSMLCAGVSIIAESPGGLWLVTPVVMLSCAAFVLGHERDALRSRFGEPSHTFSLLPDDDPHSSPPVRKRALCYFQVLLPWLALYMAVFALGVPPGSAMTYFPFEAHLRVLPWTQPVYVSCYVLVCLAPLFAKTQRALRDFEVRALLAMAFVFTLNLTVPLVASPRLFTPENVMGRLLTMEWVLAAPAAALPSFHVIWALIAAEVYAGRWPKYRWLWRGWAYAVAASCITTGMHSILDVLAGFLTFALVVRHRSLWAGIRRLAERIANSWKEWRIGPVRIINHALWAGLAGLAGVAAAGTFAGPGSVRAVLVAALVSLVVSALWAQFIEGSPALSRPYGFWGGLLGLVLGSLLAPNPWLIMAAFSVAGPWCQSLGRLRCLVQGCCHGRPASDFVGIRYMQPRSRVCKLAMLGGVPVHATPVYSILWNVPVAMFVTRLWMLACPLHLIGGVYLILIGLGRFVEEAYRGEPQTPCLLGLRLYQWIAIASVVVGALVTAVGNSAPAPRPEWSLAALPAALGFGAIAAIAMGVDFPDGQRRFSRLA